MQFDIMSDIHLGYSSRTTKIPISKYFPNKTGSDYLLIAGDLSEDIVGNESVKKFLTKASKLYKKVVVVMGNHDYWHINENIVNDRFENVLFDTIHTEFTKFVKSFETNEKIVVLQNEAVKLDDVWVYGTTLWTDIPASKYNNIQRSMNDYYCIYKKDGKFVVPITYFDTTKENFVAFNKLSDFVTTHRKEKVVLLTHHCPSFQSRSKNPKYDEDIEYAYMNDYDMFMFEHTNIRAWCYGHLHEAKDYMVGATRVVSNPLGYVGEGLSAERHYDGKKIENWKIKTVVV